MGVKFCQYSMNFSSDSQRKFCCTGQTKNDRLGSPSKGFSPSASSGRYSVTVSGEKKDSVQLSVGLCADCRFMRRIESDRGSIFYLCKLSATDATFPKYPRLPVLRCAGHKPLSERVRQ